MGLEDTDLAGGVDVGVFQQGSTTSDQSIVTGFQPSYVAFYGNMTQAALNTEYTSGANVGGGANGLSYCMGYSVGGAAADQYVSSLGQNSNSSNAHVAYAGDGEVVYLIATSNGGETIDGRARASVTSFDQDGFTLSWGSTIPETTHILYQAYR